MIKIRISGDETQAFWSSEVISIWSQSGEFLARPQTSAYIQISWRLVKPQIYGPYWAVSNSLNVGWAQGYAFQSGSQVMMLLDLEPHFENHRSDPNFNSGCTWSIEGSGIKHEVSHPHPPKKQQKLGIGI